MLGVATTRTRGQPSKERIPSESYKMMHAIIPRSRQDKTTHRWQKIGGDIVLGKVEKSELFSLPYSHFDQNEAKRSKTKQDRI